MGIQAREEWVSCKFVCRTAAVLGTDRYLSGIRM